MHVLLDMVISINGMIAREDGSEDWLPHEGYEDMLESVKLYDNLVYGRETYEYITTHEDPDYFSSVPTDNQILVTSQENFQLPNTITVAHSPQGAMEIIKSRGLDTLYLVGGGSLNGSFLQAGLVDEVRLTIHPYILTKGRSVFGDSKEFEAMLELLSTERLSLGRVRNHYKLK